MRACLTYSAADTGRESGGPHILLLTAGIVYEHWSYFTLPDTLLTLKLSVFSPGQYTPQMQGFHWSCPLPYPHTAPGTNRAVKKISVDFH